MASDEVEGHAGVGLHMILKVMIRSLDFNSSWGSTEIF